MRKLASFTGFALLLGCGADPDALGQRTAALTTPVSEQAKLQLSPTEFGQFGRSVSVHGSTLVAGTWYVTDASAHVFVSGAGGWTKQADLIPSDLENGDGYGEAVSIDGDTAAVGAGLKPNSQVASAGAVYVYVRSGASWSLQQKLTSFPEWSAKAFGRAVSLWGNTLMVGSADGTHVFVRSGIAWSLEQKLLTSASSVSLQGDRAVLGIPNSHTNEGRAEVWVRNAGTWSMEQSVAASDQTQQDRFAESVSLDGDTFASGAFGNDDGGEASGSLYVFVRSGATWTEQQKLVASDASTEARLGVSVALYGDMLVGGAHSEGSLGLYAGAAYLFTRSGTSWTEQQKIVAADTGPGDGFGNAVAMTNDWLAIGADDERAVYVFGDSAAGGSAGASGGAGAPGGSGGAAVGGGGGGGIAIGGSGGVATGGNAGSVMGGAGGSAGSATATASPSGNAGGCGCRARGREQELGGVWLALASLAFSFGWRRRRFSLSLARNE